jgi:hypothetical protein
MSTGMTCPKHVTCAEGKDCLNAMQSYVAWVGRSEARVRVGQPSETDTDRNPGLPTRGKTYALNSALQNYPTGFLDCGHFCCPVVEYDTAVAASGSGGTPLTCAQRHVNYRRCNKKGKYKYEELYNLAAATGKLVSPRPNATKARRMKDKLVSGPLNVGSGAQQPGMQTTTGTLDVRDLLAMADDEVRVNSSVYSCYM